MHAKTTLHGCGRIDLSIPYVLLCLSDEGNVAILEVKDHGRVPVLDAVDVTLRGSGDNQVIVLQRRLDDPVSEV